MTNVPKWAAAGAYIGIWGASTLLMVLLKPDWFVVLMPVVWVWTVFNLVQVWRGKRTRLWS